MKTRHYSRSQDWAYYSKAWPKEAKPYLHVGPYLHTWLDAKAVFTGKRVLDLGAGECIYTRFIADVLSPEMILASDLFRERMLPAYQSNVNPALRFVCADGFQLPFADHSFDVVFASLILCQLPGFEPIVQAIRRVLVPGGTYIGIEPNPFNVKSLLRLIRRKSSRNVYLLRPQHLRAFESAGFQVSLTWFYPKWPKVRSRLLTSAIGIRATLES